MKKKSANKLITARWVKSLLPERPADASKGTFGKVLVVAGSINYIGAAYLASMGAMRVGAGLVTLATPANLVPIVAAKLVEATYLPLSEFDGAVSKEASRTVKDALKDYNVLLVGCGLGQRTSTVEFVKSLLLHSKISLPNAIVDADALNILSGVPEWWRKLTDNAILTPHPGEMSRLAGLSVEKVQEDRSGIAREMAMKWRKTVVLKGAHTVVVSPDGETVISPFANSGLATAGTGDVLSGVITGLLAQGLSLENAATCGVFLHGQAGEMVKNRLGNAGMLASDLLPELPLAIKGLKGK